MSNNYKDQYGKNTIKIIHKGKVVSQADMKVQLGGGDVIDKPVQSNITSVDESGKTLLSVHHQAILVGDRIAQIKRSTAAKVNDDGTISITQYKSEISSSGEEVYYYDNSIGGFRGSLGQAKIAFPNVDFAGLKLPNDVVDRSNPEFANMQYVSSDDLVKWKQVGRYDAEQNGGKPTTWEAWADNVQTALDIAGLFPGLGEIADCINGCISLARGNYGDAALSIASAIPFVGAGVAALKIAKKAEKVIDKGEGVYDLIIKTQDDLAQAYVGQSKKVTKRLKEHSGNKGFLKEAKEILHGTIHKMPGSTKKEREIYEQFIIFKKYGADLNKSSKFHQLLNKVNPVGGRFNMKTKEGQDKLVEKAQELAKRWDLPTDFKPIILN